MNKPLVFVLLSFSLAGCSTPAPQQQAVEKEAPVVRDHTVSHIDAETAGAGIRTNGDLFVLFDKHAEGGNLLPVEKPASATPAQQEKQKTAPKKDASVYGRDKSIYSK